MNPLEQFTLESPGHRLGFVRLVGHPDDQPDENNYLEIDIPSDAGVLTPKKVPLDKVVKREAWTGNVQQKQRSSQWGFDYEE